jgi:hypothetical protein
LDENQTNPLSRSLLALKKAANYTINATGISAKGAVLTSTVVMSTLFTGIFINHGAADFIDAYIPAIVLEHALPCSYLITMGVGVKKADELIKGLLGNSHKMLKTIASGATYALGAVCVGIPLIEHYMDRNITEIAASLTGNPLAFSILDSFISSPALRLFVYLSLNALGIKYCLDLVSYSQEKLQAEVEKKIQ